jgi:hypothetical protein
MRRIAPVTAACATLVATVAAAHAANAPTAATTPAAKVVACDMTGADRSATFLGRMDALPRATRMAMRFQLLEKLGRTGAWSKVDVPALRQWRRALPGVRSFAYRQTVAGLRAGGAYRSRVVFRWTGAGGAQVASETRETPVCRGPLPNLAIAGVDVHPGPTSDTHNYRVTVDNDGKGDAGAVRVVLSVDRAILDAVKVAQLGAGDSRTITFTGPACHRSLRVRVDPGNAIGEVDERDNTRLFACPS